ncbi:ArsR family transcriptional regulator [Anaerocolumna aminovalerica]
MYRDLAQYMNISKAAVSHQLREL